MKKSSKLYCDFLCFFVVTVCTAIYWSNYNFVSSDLIKLTKFASFSCLPEVRQRPLTAVCMPQQCEGKKFLSFKIFFPPAALWQNRDCRATAAATEESSYKASGK